MFFISFFGHDSYICREHPKFVILTFGLCFSQLAAKMLNKTITDSEVFDQDTLSNNTFFFLLLLSLFLRPLFGTNLIDIVIKFGFLLNLISWLNYFNRLTTEVANILGIFRFKIGKQVKMNEKINS